MEYGFLAHLISCEYNFTGLHEPRLKKATTIVMEIPVEACQAPIRHYFRVTATAAHWPPG